MLLLFQRLNIELKRKNILDDNDWEYQLVDAPAFC